MQAWVKLNNTKLAVKLIRSTIGRPPNQRKIIQVLGLRKLNQVRIHDDGPRVWGMLEKVIHLVKLERIRAVDAPTMQAEKV
ncbi:unnamed protein product [Chondrus crispus]|uniref:Large ribosomal subunit protein uL30m n=1 Tax=Chondrus crispus TaxID=2769 RepID=R7QT95_CHOCR|nr:unnamed protein product [Chondrus crispus]CDF40580.1 unnamed protein product [Chondrus crispus]|eukprot:XP_005710874.1 unnamed protein product [Chondrus crispus]